MMDRRQCSRLGVGGAEDDSSAVALVNVAIDGHRTLDEFALLQAADGDAEVVEHAETFAMIGVGVMEAAPEVDAHAIFQSQLGSKDGAAGVEHESVNHL